ncbi:MAG: hypothetical protein AAGF75_10655 [Cyanobacteria bacterium P01_H01_bin.130]
MTGLLGAACGSSPSSTVTSTQTAPQEETASPAQQTAPGTSAPLPAGEYAVQQVSYDDSNGEYRLLLLGTPQGTQPVYSTNALQMARVADEDIQAGKASYLQVQGEQATLFLTPEFQIQYVPFVAENQVDPNTGESTVVYVRQRPTPWSPFSTGFVAGAIASDLLTPRYYVPPSYVVGQPLVGYGGYGNTYDRAVSSYQSRYNEPPRASRSSTQFRSTGAVTRSRSTTTTTTGSGNTRTRTTTTQQTPTTSSSPAAKTGSGASGTTSTGTTSTGTTSTVRQQPSNTTRSTGSGFGSNTLRNSGGTSTSQPRRRSGSSFGRSVRRSRPSSRPRRRRRR